MHTRSDGPDRPAGTVRSRGGGGPGGRRNGRPVSAASAGTGRKTGAWRWAGLPDFRDIGGRNGPFFCRYRRKSPRYASVCVRYASSDAYLRPHENPWNTRDWKKDNGRYALYASVFRVTLFYPFFPYGARIPRIPAQAVPRNRRNHAEKRGRKGMHHLMHTARIPGPADAYPVFRIGGGHAIQPVRRTFG